MKRLWHNIGQLWCNKIGFKLALLYLLLLVGLVLALPLLPLPYPPNHLDLDHLFLSPLSAEAIAHNHPLGTDGLGRDLLANLLYGARSAFLISFPVMLLATLLGMGLGISAGYYGDTGLNFPRHRLLLLLLTVAAALYYVIYLPLRMASYSMGPADFLFPLAVFGLLVLTFWGLTLSLSRLGYWKSMTVLPVDWLLLRSMEALSTIPGFVLILVLASFLPPSVGLLSLLLILTLWPVTARLARAEMLRIRELPYFEAAKSIGSSPGRLIWQHAFPNLFGPVLVAFSFGLGGLLALESTLSFLNIGLPTTFVSWGRIISNFRTNTAAWWLVALPGGFLSLTVLAIYTCSHYLTKAFHAK